MKIFILFFLILTQSAFACDTGELRKEIFNLFSKGTPVRDQLGEQRGITTLKEMSLTDNMMRIRGEDFFITRLVFDILWSNGVQEEKEVLMAAIVDMASCRLESFEPGETLGGSTSRK